MPTQRRTIFDFDWKFSRGDHPDAKSREFNDTNWEHVDLPHDWSIEGPFDKENPTGGSGGYLPAGFGWYRKRFHVEDVSKDGKVFIEFDGVYCNSEVWINGAYLGLHNNGYTSFSYDITDHLFSEKENVLAVRVDNSEQPGSRWYTGSGIYRHTWLVCTDKLLIPYQGTYITTPQVSNSQATVQIQTKLRNEYGKPVAATLKSYLLDGKNNVIASTKNSIELEEETVQLQNIEVTKPRLWSIEDPYLYTMKTEVLLENKVVDCIETPIGIRSIEFHHNKGFFLNDKHVKINGVCLHHDGGCVGAAVPEGVWERRLHILKEMGCNAIRMSHNPPSPELLDMCDKMGFLVMNEAFDEWTLYKYKNIPDGGGKPLPKEQQFGYYQYFEEDFEKDLTAMLHRDRNHPSIIMWSVGNEVPEQTEENGHLVLKKLVNICHEEDPTRPVTVACDQIKAEPKEATPEFLEMLDIVGYNYVNRWRGRTETFYSEDKIDNPHWKVIGSENPAIPSIRGDYFFENTSYEYFRNTYFTNMIRTEKLWKFTFMNDYVAGDFMWTGIDYLGESKWPYKNASFAPLDMCGFPKDSFYFYQSQWTKQPMLHVFPHWNWQGQEGRVIPVLCYTNCDSVELFVNDRSFGEKCYEFPLQGMSETYGHFDKPMLHPTTSDLHLSWDVPYEPGTIRMVGMRDGKVVVTKEVKTTEEPYAIRLSADKQAIQAYARAVSHITVEIVDQNGFVVPTADNEITFSVEGAGKLIGVDNGKPDSHESFQANKRKAFHGLALAIVQAVQDTGEIKIIATAEGLKSAHMTIASE
ncbi:glycoside hydrolase family 2 TIM barrel-domain containing protein [Evansella sp. AB-rgal1]|uniref:glycoside hydrolase family 2 TIM barrel-domain containing protein n=1 Tax=Evansella sp. AB-rgal1 TaxID=3242696 RepID=UPI00359E76CD